MLICVQEKPLARLSAYCSNRWLRKGHGGVCSFTL